jgi:hypothetical protein
MQPALGGIALRSVQARVAGISTLTDPPLRRRFRSRGPRAYSYRAAGKSQGSDESGCRVVRETTGRTQTCGTSIHRSRPAGLAARTDTAPTAHRRSPWRDVGSPHPPRQTPSRRVRHTKDNGSGALETPAATCRWSHIASSCAARVSDPPNGVFQEGVAAIEGPAPRRVL